MFTLSMLLLVSSVVASPLPWKREVPQEHSHEATLRIVRASLNLNNPDKIVDPVFGLLGNQAADKGKGNIQDVECLQQATADQAFTNAKAAGDVDGMVNALIFRALERNTPGVGKASNLCTSLKATNPEIAALSQHQDPASPGAAEGNKKITLELANQIKSVGGDPVDAIKSGTFTPGDVNDTTGKGNTCDDENDAEGCIFSQNLLVPDATEQEILAAVGDPKNNVQKATTPAVDPKNNDAVDPTKNNDAVDPTKNNDAVDPTKNNDAVDPTKNNDAVDPTKNNDAVDPTKNNDAVDPKNNDEKATTPTTTPADNCAADPAKTTPKSNPDKQKVNVAEVAPAGTNLQTFTGALGNKAAPAVTAGGRGFVVENNADFLNLNAALGRSCDVQKNQCADLANSNRNAGFTVGDCDKQGNDCRAAIQ